MPEQVNVLVTLPFSDGMLARLRQASPRLQVTSFRAHRREEIPPEIWAQVEVLYTNRVVPLPEEAPNLRWIQFHWAGIDHTIEAPILRRPDVVATTLSGAAASQLAEYIVMMLLALGHKLPSLFNHQKRGEWPGDRWERFSPRELRDSTVGFAGYGSIARQAARLLQPFGVRILATKRDAMHPQDTGYTPEGWGDPGGDLVTRLYPPEALRSMARECDFLVITSPLTPATRGMVNEDILGAMKPTAFLVDISRGLVVDNNALVAALRDRKIAGAALDVFAEEPLPAEHPLWKMNNVILTPHISGNTPQYDHRAIELFAENLTRYLAGKPLLNLVDTNLGY